ncbi:hypothetical protein DSM104635_02563 [Terricaulis silvestris]|uniref:DUF2846 domain-containing protein n=1 Tax=Terricaulis silvestris TaxID=2686094 RepID=A0A6I6MVR8_9CAUL|nr:hypothetical protein DSM104635_02563 [Terricaulis silvestris]
MATQVRSPMRFVCALFAATLVLSACSKFPCVYLINNSGGVVEVLRVEADRDYYGPVGRSFFGGVRIRDRSGQEILYRSSDLEVRVELKIGRCTLRYALPPTVTSSNAAAVVQLESDHKLYLVAENVWDAGRSHERPVEMWPQQPEGFPVEPVGGCA